MSSDDPNAEMVHYWNEVTGGKWVALQPVLDAFMAPISERLLAEARLAPGERVLDVGCGCGSTSLAAAAAVAPDGTVLGVDVSAPMLAHADARARAAGAADLRFLQADAQTATLPDGFDCVLSRFGLMFFSDPGAAFGRLRRALRPGGRLVFVCWQALARNAWMRVPLEAVAEVLPLPAAPAPGAPGPFALADDAHLRALVDGAGFVDVSLQPLHERLTLGTGDLEEATRFALQLGPAAAALGESPDPERLRPVVERAVRTALADYAPDGTVRLDSAAWLVSARTPGPGAG